MRRRRSNESPSTPHTQAPAQRGDFDGALPSSERFVALLARMLHEAGTPSHRLEGLVVSCAQRLGLEVYVYALPTSINISVGLPGAQRVTNFRVDPGSPKLALLEATYRVADKVARGELDAPGGVAALLSVQARQRSASTLVMCVGYALFSAGAAQFLGGTWREMMAAFPVGLTVGAALALARGRRERELLSEFGGAAVATFVAACVVALASMLGASISLSIVSLAGVVTLLPGLALATAMSELSTRNLASGSARFMGAVTTLVVVGMGTAIGARIARALDLIGAVVAPLEVSSPMQDRIELIAGTMAIAAGITVALQARLARAPMVLAACVFGWCAAETSRALVDPELVPCLAATIVGVGGNLYARWRHRPTLAIVLPGLGLLLPGSIGFRGVQGLIASDTIAGLNTAVSAMVIGASLAAGLLIANAIAPSPRNV